MKKVIAFTAFLAASSPIFSQAIHCKGTTKAGQPCASIMINKETGYCRSHDPNAKHCTFIKKDGKQCKMVVKEGETLCRFHAK